MDDVLAVLDAAGSEKASLFAHLEGGPMAILFAATFPERTRSLALYATFARTVQTDDIPWALARRGARASRSTRCSIGLGHGHPAAARSPRASPATSASQDWFGRLERHAASPGTARRLFQLTGEMDVRGVLPSIRVPTLIAAPHRRHVHRHAPLALPRGADPRRPPRDPAAAATRCRSATAPRSCSRSSRSSSPARRRGTDPDRVLATVMFTDIVDSTGARGGAGRPALARPARRATTRPCAARSSASAAARSRPSATASSPPSTARHGRSAAPR